MQGTFEFNNQYVALNKLDIDDIGNVCIECTNDDGFFYYLVIKTKYGKTYVLTYGPLIPDLTEIPNGYNVNLTKFDYNEKKVSSFIDKFLNESKKKITTAKEISLPDALKEIKDLEEYMEE